MFIKQLHFFIVCTLSLQEYSYNISDIARVILTCLDIQSDLSVIILVNKEDIEKANKNLEATTENKNEKEDELSEATDIFVHQSVIVGEDWRYLKPGQIVLIQLR